MSVGNGVEVAQAGQAGALPDGWRWARLDDVCHKKVPTIDPRQEPERAFVYLDISSIDNQTKRIINPKRLFGRDAPTRARQMIRAGDVIVSTTRPNLNAVALVPSEFDRQVCSTGFCVLRAEEPLDPCYLYYFVQSRAFVDSLSELVKGALYPAVTDGQVRAQFIPLPPLAEQRRIAAWLDRAMAAVERARAAAVAQLEVARHLSTALLNATFNSSEAHEWPTVPLKAVGDIGSGITLGRKLRTMTSTTRPYLRVANVKDGCLDLTDVKQIDVTDDEATKYALRWGDLLLTEGGDPDKLGRGTFWQEEIPGCLHQNHIFRVRFDLGQHDPAFLAAQISSDYGKRYFLAHAKQTTGIATINQRVLGEFPLRVPPLCIQRQIAEGLAEERQAVDRVVASAEGQIASISQLRAALLTQASSPPC